MDILIKIAPYPCQNICSEIFLVAQMRVEIHQVQRYGSNVCLTKLLFCLPVFYFRNNHLLWHQEVPSTSPLSSTLTSYFLFTLLLYFLFIYYLPRFTLPDFSSISSHSSSLFFLVVIGQQQQLLRFSENKLVLHDTIH